MIRGGGGLEGLSCPIRASFFPYLGDSRHWLRLIVAVGLGGACFWRGSALLVLLFSARAQSQTVARTAVNADVQGTRSTWVTLVLATATAV